MQIKKIETGNFKLDGGAMFGVVPKVLWEKAYPADDNNMCNLSMRCLYVEDDDRKILIDTGLGDKQDEKFLSYYYLNGSDSLNNSLESEGISYESISDVILTHLHFDHVGGAVTKDPETNSYKPSFPNATYWVSKAQWDWYKNPNSREKASYLNENIQPLEAAGKIKFIEEEGVFTSNIQVRIFNGHTAGLVVPIINYKGTKLVYAADLFPTLAHLPISWVCAYDTRPLVSFKEREIFLKEALENNYTFFFEHDLYHECCTLQETKKGIRADRCLSLVDFLSNTNSFHIR